MEAPLRVQLPVPDRYLVHRTFSVYRMGPGDPTFHLEPGRIATARWTPEGAVAVEVTQTPERLEAQLWGSGAAWFVERLSAFLGLEDDPSAFDPRDAAMRAVWKKSLGTHLPRLPTVFVRTVQVILLQLVTTKEGNRAWRMLVQKLGATAPGPGGLRLPPRPDELAGAPWYGLVALGVPHKQARTVVRVARAHESLELEAAKGPDDLEAHLLRTPGIGPWSTGYVLGTALADADAVLVGDHGLPHTTAWLLAREERATDERMLELLAPYAGHRFRAIRAIWMYGTKAPRRGPKRAPRPLHEVW